MSQCSQDREEVCHDVISGLGEWDALDNKFSLEVWEILETQLPWLLVSVDAGEFCLSYPLLFELSFSFLAFVELICLTVQTT